MRRLLMEGGDDRETASRFLSKAECRALGDRIIAKATGGGQTFIGLWSNWAGNLRWARNEISTGGDVENVVINVGRTLFGATGQAGTNALDDETLRVMVAEAERLRLWSDQAPETYPVEFQDTPQVEHPTTNPNIWFDATYTLSAEGRARTIEPMLAEARSAGMLVAGYIQNGAHGYAVIRNGTSPMFRYYPVTTAQFSVTVRDPRGTQSGWAGVDFSDWNRIDTMGLFRIALTKCQKSRNPVSVEPGRYTAILEPQAVCDLFEPVMESLSRVQAENGAGPFASAQRGFSKIGERVMDERITVSADPMDPDLGYVPFDGGGEPHRKVNWIEHGVLKALDYHRYYGVSQLQDDWALPNSSAFRISGGTTTLDEMIATTERGVLVTRFHNVTVLDRNTLLASGVTRDGLWLIERGKISKSIKNFRFTESPLFVLNNVEQLGVPQRVFHPKTPVVCPTLKVRDFSFTGLMDAV